MQKVRFISAHLFALALFFSVTLCAGRCCSAMAGLQPPSVADSKPESAQQEMSDHGHCASKTQSALHESQEQQQDKSSLVPSRICSCNGPGDQAPADLITQSKSPNTGAKQFSAIAESVPVLITDRTGTILPAATGPPTHSPPFSGFAISLRI